MVVWKLRRYRNEDFEGYVATLERGKSLFTLHTAVDNGKMVEFSTKNGFKIKGRLKEFWGRTRRTPP